MHSRVHRETDFIVPSVPSVASVPSDAPPPLTLSLGTVFVYGSAHAGGEPRARSIGRRGELVRRRSPWRTAVSIHTPFLGTTASRVECPIPTGPLGLPQLASLPARFPARSAWVRATVRIARATQWVTTRVVARRDRVVPAREPLVELTLQGLDQLCRRVPGYRDVVTGERAWLQIERNIAQRSLRHHRFLALRRAMLTTRPALKETGPLEIYLNPACCWIREDDRTSCRQPPGGTSLYFLVERRLCRVDLDLQGQALINELADYQPCTVSQWARLSALLDARGLVVLIRHLAELGLVAYG
jgi:hypothetical protein